jgi:hypothetical protein
MSDETNAFLTLLEDSHFVHESHNGDRLDAAYITEGQRNITLI